MNNVFLYSEEDFISSVEWGQDKQSPFDLLTEEVWEHKESTDVLRYKLKSLPWKVLEGRFGMVATLNVNRATNRRPPEVFTSIDEPFDGSRFNFTAAPEREVMFKLRHKEGSEGDVMMLNVSPLARCHCLLLPQLESRLPQRLCHHSLRLAVSVLLLSNSPGFRVCFNSLCGFASVNHLHLHTYLLDQQMYLETAEVETLAGPVYQLVDYPARGYVLLLSSPSHLESFIRDGMMLVEAMVQAGVAHNLYLTRGTGLAPPTLTRDHVRLYLWPRTHSSVKELTAFNPAAAECFGHLVVKDEQQYASITEEYVSDVLREITDQPFERTKPAISKLFTVQLLDSNQS